MTSLVLSAVMLATSLWQSSGYQRTSIEPAHSLVAGCSSAQFRADGAQRWARRAWEVAGRPWLSRYSGVEWESNDSRWHLDQSWRYRDSSVATQAYFAEYALRPAVELATDTKDLRLVEELAEFYLQYLPRFTTLGTARARFGAAGTSALADQGDGAARTLLDVQRSESGQLRPRECVTCTLQFLYPAARLIRVISTLPDAQRTKVMMRFVAIYTPLIAKEQLVRLGYEAKWSYWGDKTLPTQLVSVWQVIRAHADKPAKSYQRAMLDSDLWLLASAAELLAAHSNDAEAVPLDAVVEHQLSALLRGGVALFQSKRHLHRDSRDFSGRIVTTASYFDGDFVDHPDYAFVGLNTDTLPDKLNPHPRATSWDISHAYRIPVFLEALSETRNRTGLNFPSDDDVRLVVDQYLFRVFNRNWRQPLFANFFDGSDGWYRVDTLRRSGIPPSRFCDTRAGNRPCLAPGALFGWGMIATVQPDLAALQRALVQMSLATDSATVAFRDRYYTYGGESFAACDAAGNARYPFLLFVVIASAVKVL